MRSWWAACPHGHAGGITAGINNVAGMTGAESSVSLQCSIYKNWQNEGSVESRAKRTSGIIKPNLLFNKPGN